MPNFFFKGQKVFANDIDIDRLARKIRQYSALCPNGQPLLNKDQALELVAHALGANSQYELRQLAVSGSAAAEAYHRNNERDIRGMSKDEIQRLVWRLAITKGKPFPGNLPARFTTQRLDEMENLFLKASSLREPGKLEFVALVGLSGSGKTILAEHLTAKYGGRTIDTGLSLSNGHGYRYGNGSVLVFDQPAVLSESSSLNIPFSDMPEVPEFKSLEEYREYHRTRYTGIPHDEFLTVPPGLIVDRSIRHWLRDNPQINLVLCFADLNEARTALDSSTIVLDKSGEQADNAEFNWRRAHVIDLNNMQLTTLDGPGLAMEEERYIPTATTLVEEGPNPIF